MDMANRAAIRDGSFSPLEESLGKEVVRLRAIVSELVRLDDESDLRCADSCGLVILLGEARSANSGETDAG